MDYRKVECKSLNMFCLDDISDSVSARNIRNKITSYTFFFHGNQAR